MATPTSSSSVVRVSAPGTSHIASLLIGTKWAAGDGGGTTLTYSFPGAASVWSTASQWNGGYGSQSGSGEPWDARFFALSDTQKAAFRSALGAWAAVANIRFVEVEDTATSCGDIRVAFSGAVSDTSSAHAYYPYGVNAAGGDVWLNPDARTNSTPQAGNFGFMTYVHEIGHALGLKHSFSGGSVLPDATDNQQYTVMAYDRAPNAVIYPAGPMLYDVAAIQYLYGANTSWHTGNDSYQFSASAEVLQALWDAGGTDTLDASNQLAAAAIDLNAGGFSSIGVKNNGAPASNNVAIAYGVTIENAYGSAAGDTITGNAADNMILGNAGGDFVFGGEGADWVNGGAGEDFAHGGGASDTLWGGQGNDTIWGGQGNDDVNGNLGNDAVNGNLGNDTLRGGQGHDTVYGGAGSDLVEGNLGDDRLAGNLGDDTLSGGSGADRFEYRSGWGQDVITDFNAADGDRIELAGGTGYTAEATASGTLRLSVGGSASSIILAGHTRAEFSAAWIVVV